MKVLPAPPAGLGVPAASLAGLQTAHSEHVRSDPASLEQLRKRNQQYLERFDEAERDEELP